jgi:photosynthetic reaction center cytochrome c subunit
MSRGTVVTRAFVFLVLAALVGLSIGARAQQPAPAASAGSSASAPQGPLASEKYKNIQALKDVPADQIEATMHFIEAATGLRCGDCHVQEANGQFAFDKDDKREKTTARDMIKIVRGVNDQFFKGEMRVSCQTCHRGGRPMGTPALAAMLTPEQVAAMAQPPAAPQQGAGRAPGPAGAPGPGPGGRGGPPAVPIDDVLNKYVTALGGRPAVEKLQSIVVAGTLTNRANQNLSFTIEQKLAGKYRESIQSQPAVTRGTDGKAGWLQSGERVQVLGDFRLAEATRLSDLGLPLAIKEKFSGLRGVRAPQIDGKPTVAIAGDRSRDVTETLIFDPASGLLLRRAIVTRTPVGNLSEQVDYSDYRDVAGVKIPFLVMRKTWEANDTFKIVDVKPNAQIDDSRFAKPN